MVVKTGAPSMGSFTCVFCRLRPSTRPKTRSFTTSTSRRAIPPESPHYVDVPSSLQPDLYHPRRPKGVLPVPRELFPVQRPDKPSESYIQNVTPDKRPENITPVSHQTLLSQHRSRMSALRKQHLRTSLVDLHKRKETITRQISVRSTAKLEESERLRTQPIREDERLTNVSVPSAMLPQPPTQYDEGTAVTIAQTKQARFKRARDSAALKDRSALHALYMNARHFITTEEQLLAEIEQTFLPASRNPEFRRSDFAETGENIWVRGVPATVAEMIQENTVRAPRTGQPPSPSEMKIKFRKDQERMKKIAEELSGGKI